jgi:hypothetical protein
MSIPELVFTEKDLAELETIKSKLQVTLASQKPIKRAEAPELGDEELDIEGLEN